MRFNSPRIKYASPPVILFLSLLAYGESGSTWKFQAEALAGYHTNPLYLSPDDSLLQSSPALLGTASAKWRYLSTESWQLRSALEGDASLFSNLAQGNIRGLEWTGESRYSPHGAISGKKLKDETYAALSLRMNATDNAILSNPDRSDPDVPALGLMESRARITGRLDLDALGALQAMSGAGYRNYEEAPSLLASLDSHQEEAEAGWALPEWRRLVPEIQYAVKSRRYLEYPARDRNGDTVSGELKSLFSHGPTVRLGLLMGRKTDFWLEYNLEVRRDLYQGYFNCVAYSPGMYFKFKGASKWELTFRGWTALERYDTYRVGYNANRALKRIRYDFLRTTFEIPFGRLYFRAEGLYRGEANNTPSYQYSAPQVFAGFGFKT